MNQKGIKCVAIGDPTVGKSSMFISFTSSGFVKDYVPTTFDNFNKNLVTADGGVISMHLWDTAGQDELAHLRQLSYAQADVFIVCFAVNLPSSYENIYSKWLPELKMFSQDTPIVLIGTKIDLRNGNDKSFISPAKGKEMARNIGALGYFECSALTQEGLNKAFLGVVQGLQDLQKSKKTGKKKDKCSIM
eukprot:TRINITY_DN1041_c0_g1_i1.p1 TRINITY_DN1041_c0_g1~~TRINITY_DN1041_c0_g1_i1.p1  ORF type:complete len:190 (+),score=49.54 TRINITY_DN1041_c0_g1_i1:95-664(+)